MSLRVICPVPHSYDLSPNQRYRWEQWQPWLAKEGIELDFLPFCSPELDADVRGGKSLRAAARAALRYPGWLREMRAAESADVVVIPRKSVPAGPFWAEAQLAHKARSFVYDFDDAIFQPTPGHSRLREFVTQGMARCRHLCEAADIVLTGNDYLATYARQHCQDVRVIPTTVETTRYLPRPQPRSADSPVIVGWIGSRTTARYLVDLLPTLAELQRSVPFELLVVGATVELGAVRGRAVPWSAATEIPLLQEMDIGIMPLEESPWELGKCSLKALLYQAVGIPAVVSDVGTNREAVLDGVTGTLVRSPEDWGRALVQLIAQGEHRAELGRRARSHMEDHYSARVWTPKIADALRTATGARADR
jgi:glycosyltransferase involved in cell wall biosynthesis